MANTSKTKKYATYESQAFGGYVVIDPTTEQRRIKISAPLLYQHFLDHTCSLGDYVSMAITNKKPKRTAQQNSYYHLYLSLISISSGSSVKALKKWAVGKFLSTGITEVFGEKVRMVKSSAELTVSEFIEFLARIEETTEIPLPDAEPFLKPLSHEEYAELKANEKRVYQKLVAKNIPKKIKK